MLNSSGSAVGSKESVINKIDKSNPTFTGAEVKNVSVSGYDVYIYGVSDVGSGIKQVLFPTWTATNGQDDIIWGSGTNEGNGTWHYRVNISEHNNESGLYITHIYIYDNVENTGSTAMPTQNIKKLNPITVTNKSMYTGASLDLSTAVTKAQGTVTYAIKTNGTTTASTLSGSRLTAGAMNTANDNNQTVVVTATAAGNDDYYSGSKDITITVQKYTPTLKWTSTTPDSSIAYGTTGKSATVTASVTGGTKGAITYTSGTPGVLTINASTGALTTAGVGNSVITASIARTATVKAGSTTKTISVTKKSITVPKGKTLTYNGSSQTGVSAGSGYTLSGTTSATNASTTAYSATAALTDATNTQWSDGTTANKTITWKINPKNLSGNVTVADVATIKYTGGAITPVPTVKDNARNVNLTPGKDYGISYSNNVNVGTATITLTGEGNYTGTTTKTFTISKATNPITVTAKTLKYTGSAQSLVTTANAQGTVYYSVGTALTSSNYSTAGSTTIPTRTAANESGYVVYYYCVGNGNYNAKSGSVIVKIAKIPAVNPTLTDVTVPYDTKAHAISVSGGSGGTIYYRISTDNSTWGSWTTTKPTRTSVGTTYVQAYVKGDSNHSNSSATTSKKITIQTSYWKNTTKKTYYATTASAISAAAANDTLELQRNFTDAGTVSINKALNINLNSYTWTKTTSTITITADGTVYLGADKGKITTSGAFNLITNSGTLVLGGPTSFNGSLENTNTSSSYYVVKNTGMFTQIGGTITAYGIGIYNDEDGKVTIPSATINANYHAIKNHKGSTSISGGIITGNKGTGVEWSAVCNDADGILDVSGGATIQGSNHQGISNYGTCTISGGTVKSGNASNAITNNDTGKVTITGGTIKGSNYQVISNHGTCTIGGGTVKSENASNAITNQKTGKVTITGGTVSTTKGYAIRSLSNETAAVAISGGTVTSSTTSGTISNEAAGTITLSGGTIENTNLNQEGGVPTIRNTSTGKIKIDGATVKTGGYGVYNTGAGAVELSKGSIGYSGSTSKYIGQVGIYTTGTGKITMSGGSITSMEDGIYSKGNSITISKGTISAKYIGVKMLGSSLVISGQSSTTTTIVSGDIGVSATQNVNITITGGSIKGANYGIQRNTSISGNTTSGTLNIGTISSTSENNPLIYGGTAIQSITAVNCYSGLISGAGLCITGSTITVGGATTNKTNSPTIILRGNASSTKPVISTSGGITYYSGRIGATGGTYVKVDNNTKTPIMFKCYGWTNKSKSSISYNPMPVANAPTIIVNGTKYSMTPYNSLTYTK